VVIIFVDFQTEDPVMVDREGEDQGSDLVFMFREESGGEVAVGDGDVVRG
jgi:hypothetical protein